MRRALLLVLLSSCVQTRSVALTFGSEGEGLDGFMCKDSAGAFLLSRLPADGHASLVVDFVRLGGVPGCCVDVTLPAPGAPREELRASLLAALRASGAKEALADAPDEFVLVRVVGTVQGCDSLIPAGNAALPAFDKSLLIGCAYSCPVLFDKVEQDVYLGFETLTSACEQSVRTCSDGQLQWQP